MRCLLIILAACLPLVAHAVEFDEHTRSLSLGTALEVFEDTSGTATFDDVHAAAMAGAFRPVAADTFNAGYSRSAFWLKADLLYRPNDPAWQMDWVLELAIHPSITSISTCAMPLARCGWPGEPVTGFRSPVGKSARPAMYST